MKQIDLILCELIKCALWDNPVPNDLLSTLSENDWESVYKEIQEQCIDLLFADLIKGIDIPERIKINWTAICYNRISFNAKLLHLQKDVCGLFAQESINYVILKGYAAAVYYPKPQCRSMGDLDLIVPQKDLNHANEVMRAKYGKPTINYMRNDKSLAREYIYKNDGLRIELHRQFSDLPIPCQNDLLNEWIEQDLLSPRLVEIQNNVIFSMLSEKINGLVLLAHISQHLEGGLGLRQIIDWMLYVNNCLADNKWSAFADNARKLGLETLAITVTKMCQIYLGLSSENIHWADSAEIDLCEELMEFVLSCGNFGNKMGMSNTVAMVVSQNQSLHALLRNLQKRGEYNWKILEKYPKLRPFAGVYQLFRYVNKGLKRENAISELPKDIESGRKRDRMLKRLGAMRMKN